VRLQAAHFDERESLLDLYMRAWETALPEQAKAA